MSWKKALRKVNKAGRIAKDIEAVTSGSPKKMARRAKSKAKAKTLGKLGFWKW